MRITIRAWIMIVIALTVILWPASAICGYKIDWYTIDCGGGTSSGGSYTLTGTIGQADSEYSSSDGYELLGGFWPGGSVCLVEFDDFSRFADSWLQIGAGLAGDIDMDNDVDMEDLSWLADFWLSYCPTPWPLK